MINKKIMKSLLAFLLSTLTWYGIISFILWNEHIEVWHWTARVSFVVLSLLTFTKANKNI